MTEDSNKKEILTFYCQNKIHRKYVFVTNEWADDGERIMAPCPICDEPAPNVHNRYRSAYAAWNAATGPRTEKGKARSRLNGWKHGQYSQLDILMAPALPGKFLECATCELRKPCEDKENPYKYCPVSLEPMMRFIKAFKEGNIEDLRDLAAFSHGQAFSILRMMFQDVFKRGVSTLNATKTITNPKTGEEIPVISYEANPILRRIPEFVQMLGFNAEQQMMTPKTERDEENLQGYLKSEESRTASLDSFSEKVTKSIMDLRMKVEKAAVARSTDPAFIRHAKEIADENKGNEETN